MFLYAYLRCQQRRTHNNATSIHCVDWVEDFVLCPLTVSNNQIDYSNFSTISKEVLEYKLRSDTADHVTVERYQKNDGKGGVYWATGMMDGFDAAGWLHPQKLEQIAGGPVLVAQPRRGMFCFWLKSNGDAHKNMAVGIKEVYISSKEPISSKVYYWTGDDWMVWGRRLCHRHKIHRHPRSLLPQNESGIIPHQLVVVSYSGTKRNVVIQDRVQKRLRNLAKRIAKRVERNNLFEQPGERPSQEPIFEDATDQTIQLMKAEEIEEILLEARVVNHWATWCDPCVEELDILASIQSHIGADKMLGINWDLFQGDHLMRQKLKSRHRQRRLDWSIDIVSYRMIQRCSLLILGWKSKWFLKPLYIHRHLKCCFIGLAC